MAGLFYKESQMEKRRDRKGRVLRPGESQDKSGRYKYTFYEGGKQKAFYSWKLEQTDRLPAGKGIVFL